jgi:hypothetical protein
MIIHLENTTFKSLSTNNSVYKEICKDDNFIKSTFKKIMNMPKNNIYDKNYKSESFLFNKIHSSIEPDNAGLNSNELFKFFKNLRII